MLRNYFDQVVKPSVDKLEALQSKRRIPVKVYEEVDRNGVSPVTETDPNRYITWINVRGINTPYLVTIVGGK